MRKLVLLSALLCAAVLLISASPVRAQTVLWVANFGNDANPSCTQATPCATFQGAINKGAIQINCVNSGSYGPVVITASIVIDCGTGNIGTMVNTIGAAVLINAGGPVNIVLRHLALWGPGSNGDGIFPASFPSGTLILEDCQIHGFTNGVGIRFQPSSGRGTLQVSNSQMYGNVNGISVEPAANQIASVTLDQVRLTANLGNGLVLTGPGVVAGTMRYSLAATNGVNGVFSDASQVFFTIEETSLIANLQAGIRTASSGTSIKVGASTIGGNATGIRTVSGSIVSFGNNQISDNRTNGDFTGTLALQ